MTVEAFTRVARTCRASSAPSGGGMRISKKMAWNFSFLMREPASVERLNFDSYLQLNEHKQPR
jgi:hypothetical protein